MNYIFASVVVPCSVTVPVAVAAARRRRLSRACTYIAVYLCFSILPSILSVILANRGINNMPVLHTDTIVETILYCAFFGCVLRGRRLRIAVLVLMVVFPPYSVVNLLWFQSVYGFNTYTRSLESLFFIFFSTCYWLQSTGDENNSQSWGDNSDNWIVTGILLYFSSSFFLFLFSNFLAAKQSLGTNLFIWNLHAVLTLVMFFLFAIGFFKCTR